MRLTSPKRVLSWWWSMSTTSGAAVEERRVRAEPSLVRAVDGEEHPLGDGRRAGSRSTPLERHERVLARERRVAGEEHRRCPCRAARARAASRASTRARRRPGSRGSRRGSGRASRSAAATACMSARRVIRRRILGRELVDQLASCARPARPTDRIRRTDAGSASAGARARAAPGGRRARPSSPWSVRSALRSPTRGRSTKTVACAEVRRHLHAGDRHEADPRVLELGERRPRAPAGSPRSPVAPPAAQSPGTTTSRSARTSSYSWPLS